MKDNVFSFIICFSLGLLLLAVSIGLAFKHEPTYVLTMPFVAVFMWGAGYNIGRLASS